MKAKTIIAVKIIVLVIDMFIIISKLYNRAELTKSHESAPVMTFWLLLGRSYGQIKIIPIFPLL